MCLVDLATASQETRGFRKEQAAKEQNDGRNGGTAKHPTPTGIHAGERIVGDICQENTRHHHKLEQTGNSATLMRLGQFGEICRNQGGSRADSQAKDNAENNQRPIAQRKAGTQRADHEDDGRNQQQFAAAKGIGQRPDERGAEHSAKQHRADDPALLPFAQLHLLLNKQDGAGNHTGVVAE